MKRSFITTFLLLIVLFITVNPGHSFLLKESTGGISTSLGGVILDRDMDGLNIIYNPSLIAVYTEKDPDTLKISASGAVNPYGIQGINNAALGLTYGQIKGDFSIGYGFGLQIFSVSEGLSEYNIYLGASSFYKNNLGILKFWDGAALSYNFKLKYFNVNQDVTGITGFQNSILGFDSDVDFTLSFDKQHYSIGFFALDLFANQLSLLGNSSADTIKRALILHTKIRIVENFDFFASINLTGDPHYISPDNFFNSATKLADKYFGVEATFIDVLFVRVGVNEGRLGGGIGLKANNLKVNIGVIPIPGVNLYYQADISYKTSFFKKD